MNSLNEHLRAGASHDRLPFHASCPICRQRRLHGRLEPAPLVPVKTQAAILAGVVAASSAVPPTAALAVEADRTTDGSVPVSQVAPSDAAASSDFDPGGGDTSLPDQAPAAEAAAPAPEPIEDDAAPVDAPPAVDVAEPVVEAREAPAAPEAPSAAPAADPTAPVQTAPAAPPAAPPTTAANPAPTPAAASAPTKSERRSVSATKHPAKKRERDTVPSGQDSAVVSTASARPAALATPAAVTAQAPRVRVVVSGPTHVVQSGESLWAIADAVLGGDASSAQIAREVHRLWQLNAARIGTGNPELLVVGTRLALR